MFNKIRMENYIRNKKCEYLSAILDRSYKYRCSETNYLFIVLQRTPLNFYFQSFGPVVECVPEDAFLPAPIEQLMKRAQPIPIIVGINNYEGLLAFRSELNNSKFFFYINSSEY